MSVPRLEPPLLELPDRDALRAWLEANHATSPVVRLAIGKKGTMVTALTYDDAVEEGLCFGWIDSTARRLDADRHTVLFSRRKPRGTWSRSNKERVGRLLAQGLMARASQRKIALYRIASAKRQETRSRRVSEVVRAAAEGRTLWT